MRVHRTRLTAAMDAAGCEGARVDRVLGGHEPMVDEWEAGATTPEPVQLLWLAEMTGVNLAWLLDPAPAAVVARVCPGFRPVYEIPPGADPEQAAATLADWRHLHKQRAPIIGYRPLPPRPRGVRPRL